MYKISSESIGDVKKYVWHYRKDNKEYGPFTYEDIVDMVNKGEIGSEDYVLKFGNRKFVKVSEVQGLSEVIKEHEEKKEEQMPISEDQPKENKEEQPEVKKEEIKEEFHIAFENRTTHIQGKRKPEPSNNKIIIIIAGILGLCLAAWLVIRLL